MKLKYNQKQSLVAEFPAYRVYKREPDHNGFVHLSSDDVIGLESGLGFYRRYSPGSVVSYALQYNDDPLAAVERAKARGHQLHWINALSSCLSSSPLPQEEIVSVEVGLKVIFEGLRAEIAPAPNNNLMFKPVLEMA